MAPDALLSRIEGVFQRHQSWSLAAAALVGLLLRSIGIASRPIWYDEAFAILFSEKGPASMLIGTLGPTLTGASDIHPIGYYTVLWEWMRLFGTSLQSVRALSVLSSTISIYVIGLTARELFGQRISLVSALLVAAAPFQVHYGQEIRMYAFMEMWLALTTYFLVRGTRSSSWLWWLGFAVAGAMAQYAHNLAGLYLLSLALCPLLKRDWHLAGRVAIAGAIALLLYAPWLIHVPGQLMKVQQAYWVEMPNPSRLLTLLLAYVTGLPVNARTLGVALFSSLAVSALVIYEAARQGRQHRHSLGSVPWLVFLAFMPPILAFLASLWTPVYLERTFIMSGAIYCIAMAWLLAGEGRHALIRGMASVLVLAGFAIGLQEHWTYGGFPYAPYKDLAQHLEANLEPGDLVVHSSKLTALPTYYFDRQLPSRYVGDPSGAPQDTLAPETQRVLGLQASQDMEQATSGAGRVWFVIFTRSNDEYIRAGLDGHPQLTWLMQHFRLHQIQHWDELDVYLFSRST